MATKNINVTDLTSEERRKLFIDFKNQSGFTGFIKNQDLQNKKTYFTFKYEK